MRRTHAEALALVNWKGAFYDRYVLDPRVTALEGSNGAGKTTVMIAAYVVLLPDLKYLRFTNLGESGKSGGEKGIWGRLGEGNSPSYAVIDFRLGTKGERLLAGVQLERRSKPTVELTPFVATGLGDDVSLQEILLDRSDELDAVPDLNRLRELVTLGGGQLKTFSKNTSDYFVALFDHGVTPLRLTTPAERKKLNDMLRTSMVGGISRSLTGGLRDFLLRAETGLADTLKRMRGNLNACRRTRLEVENAQRMEQEIHSVYEAGHAMFVAAIHATRERADELRQRVVQARNKLESAREEERKLAEELEQTKSAHKAAIEQQKDVRSELTTASNELAVVSLAHKIATRIQKRELERGKLAKSARNARKKEQSAREARERARSRTKVAQEEFKTAVSGLSSFQKGLAELHRRAAAFSKVSEQLAVARRGLPHENVLPETVADLCVACEIRVSEHDRELVRLERTAATAEEHRKEYTHVLAALSEIHGKPVPEANVHALARRELHALRDLKALASELPELPARTKEALARASLQTETRHVAVRWIHPEKPLVCAKDVRDAFELTCENLETMRDALSAEKETINLAKSEAKQVNDQREKLTKRLDDWREIQQMAVSLGEAWQLPQPLSRRCDVEALQQLLLMKANEVRSQISTQNNRLNELNSLADNLEHSGGNFDPLLVQARDAVDGEFLVGNFEDVSVEKAGRVQALLGPLVEAIIVEDVTKAAQKLAEEEHRPGTVWLVDERTPVADHLDAFGETELLSTNDSVFVELDFGTRLTSISKNPIIGRKARTRRIATLRQKIDLVERELVTLRGTERQIAESQSKTARLVGDVQLLESPDPTIELKKLQATLDSLAKSIKRCETEIEHLNVQVGALVGRRNALQALAPNAHLLDLPDQTKVHSRLVKRLSAAQAAVRRLQCIAGSHNTLQEHLDVLRKPPPTDDELADLKRKRHEVCQQRDRLATTFDALRYVEENTHALVWSDAPEALQTEEALQPALDEQVRLAEEALTTAQSQQKVAENALDCASESLRIADTDLGQLDVALLRDREELAETGIKDASDGALSSAQAAVTALETRAATIECQEQQLRTAVAETRVRHETQANLVKKLDAELTSKEGSWRPHADRWERLQNEARNADVLDSAMTERHLAQTRGTGSVNLHQKAAKNGGRLVVQLAHANGGTDQADTIRATLESANQESSISYLHAWLATLEWLRRRVPPQIAEVDDPLESLARVRDHLDQLQKRLVQQEKNLRGQSEDVARNIEAQRRKARREVSRLNRDLQNIRFGSIRGVRIHVQSVESREQVLRALREGEAQKLLFQSDMAIEDAMAELFKRYGGGKTGGHRLLDYREYLDLQIQVLRQESREWELANPNQMSTGEAIGVGAAIMMVVLTAWERHTNLLRAKRAAGTLRLLFLDEANRLSHDNLGVLFELCDNLELQLLIAAPEVAQAEGNTTYRLVRQVDKDGHEEVLATGRRTPRGNA